MPAPLAPAIAAAEIGLPLDLVFVDIMSEPHKLADGRDYAAITPLGYVPLLERDDGSRLTEVSAILLELADASGRVGPAPGAPGRSELHAALTFIGTELHKLYSPWLFHPEVGEVAQAYARAKIATRYGQIERQLAGRSYLLGDSFSVADAYLFVPVNWAALAKTPLDDFPNIRAWFERMKARPAVRAAIRSHAAMPTRVAA